jgi:transposase
MSKPIVVACSKRQRNDAADAETICEAAQRPSMRFVPVKTEEQQANDIVFRARDLLVRQRTQCVNALRGHLMEYGYVFPKGITHVETLVAVVEDLQFQHLMMHMATKSRPCRAHTPWAPFAIMSAFG